MATDKVQFTRPTSSGENVVHPETEVDQVTDFASGVLAQVIAQAKSLLIADDYFYRPSLFTSNKTSITIPKGLHVVVNGRYYKTDTAKTISIPSSITAANRKGKNLYVYACQNSNTASTDPVIVISANSTYPTETGQVYTAATSRKIGGFHCLCANVGTIEGHDLSGYIAGDILPASLWDLKHRPQSEPEGMVFDEKLNIWVDIYLASVSGSTLLSQYNVATADGGSSVKFDWYKFNQWFARTKKRLPFQFEFMQFSLGSNQETNITGSKDATNAGGHVDTASRRMISNIGVEDCCGFLWQWALDRGGENTNSSLNDGVIGTTTGTTWLPAYNTTDGTHDTDPTIDDARYGQHYAAPFCALLGGNWGHGACCGSRASTWSDRPLNLHSLLGARGVSSPKCA